MNDEEVLNYFYGINRKRLNKKLLNNIPTYIKKYLDSRYDDTTSYEETLIRMLLHINKHPICICGKPCKFIGKRSRVFLKTCGDKECEHKIIQEHVQETCLEKYGVTNVAKADAIKIKTRNTCLKTYGCSSSLLNVAIKEKTKQTNIKKYGCEIAQQSDCVKRKIANSNKTTCMNRYGVENVLQIQEIKDKQLQTCLERYGVTNVLKVAEIQQKINNTCLERYGVPYATQNDEIKQKVLNSFIQHNLEKYGYAFPSQVPEIQTKIKKQYIATCIQKYRVDNIAKVTSIYEKVLNTKRKNHSFNTSKTEDEVYELLKNRYKDVFRNYQSTEYPFMCDFYIKDEDIYIECNFHWTHGKHFYDANNIEDCEIVSKWKAKNTKYYTNAIHTWTVRDVNKLKIATQNQLNYLVFWNIKEFKNWLKSTV